MSPIEIYTRTYPQLTLPVKSGESKSEEYLNITRKCIFPEKFEFPLKETGHEEIIELDTPVGKVQALYLPDRQIFERFAQVLFYRCEPEPIPKNTGAMMISGINNIGKFLAGEENYKDTVILISRGNYSNITPNEVNMSEDEWIDISKRIRIFHESTHYISRKLYLSHKDAVRDEVIADCIGILGAKGQFDAELERTVLGIGNGRISESARLKNYVPSEEVEAKAEYADGLIDKLEDFCKKNQFKDPFDYLLKIEDEYLR